MKAVSIIVEGNVQGVGFRYFTSMNADKLGIKGWVRNLPNGNVEIEAIGEESILDRFIRVVSDGPPYSSVDFIDVKELQETPPYTSFRITY